METFDFRSLACPEPTVRTKRQLAANPKAGIVVLVTHPNQSESVQGVAERMGHSAKIEPRDGHFAVHIEPKA